MTDEHPYHRRGDGWTPARDLAAGDIVAGESGLLELVANVGEDHPQGVTVYNLEVEQAHTYFVLAEHAPADADAVWVHNARYPKRTIANVPDKSFVPNASVARRYTRPTGAGPTAAQRAHVQGKPCVDCGAVTSKQVADHIDPLVVQHYRDGTVDVSGQSMVDAVQPHCPSCSSSQGGQLSAFAKRMADQLGL